MRWQAVPAEFLLLREFGNELVVLNDLTGSTHLLQALPAEVLRMLMMASGGLSASELAARLADGSDAHGDWLKSIEVTLSEFQRLGLAQPAG